MMKRWVIALLLLALCLSVAGAACAAVYVGDVDVTTGHESPTTLFGGQVSYDQTTKVLTLDGVRIGKTYATYFPATSTSYAMAASIYIEESGPVTIVLKGANDVQGADKTSLAAGDVDMSMGVYSTTPIAFSGSGSLRTTGGDTDAISHGIGTDAMDVSVRDCTLTAIGGPAGNSAGLFCDEFVMYSGNVTLTGGRASGSLGLSSYRLSMQGGTLKATGGPSTEMSIGISCDDSASIFAGTVSAEAGILRSSGGIAFGIDCSTFSIDSGSVYASSNTGNPTTGIGLNADDQLSINGGTTVALGNEAATDSPDFRLSAPWYEWKSATTSAEPAGAFTKSAHLPYVWKLADKYLHIRPVYTPPPPPPPSTGDRVDPIGLAALALLSATATVVLLRRKRKLG